MIDVLHVSPALFGADGAWGGGERYAVELARAQARVVRTRLVSIGEQPGSWRDGNLSISVLQVRHRWKGHELNALSERLVPLIARSRVIHVHQYNTALTSACLVAASIVRRPVFVTDHGGSGPSLNQRFRLHRLVRQYLAVSRHAVKFFPELAERSAVIYGGVDRTRFTRPGPGDSRGREVVFVGRVMPHKGIDVLIDAIDPSIPLHIYGRAYDADYRQYLASRVEDKNVTFHHEASDEEIVIALQRARVAVLPSVHRTYDGRSAPNAEYFGLVLAEAMACGTPTIGTNVGGIPEVIDDGVTGLVVEPNDPPALRAAISSLVAADEVTWHAFSVAASARVEQHFTWERVADRCLACYRLAASL